MGVQKYLTESAAETHRLGQKIGLQLSSGCVFCLTGPLGSGKTVFAQGLAEGLGIRERVLSPTFILMREYDLHRPGLSRFYHLDFYRLESAGEVEALGLGEIFQDPQAVVVIEWGEKVRSVLPAEYRQVVFSGEGDEKRSVRLEKIRAED